MPRREPPPSPPLTTAERVARRVLRRVVDENELDDLVQETMERLWRNRDRLAPEAIAPFVAVTARNLAITRARTSARRQRLQHRLPGPEVVPDASERLSLEEVRRAVAETLEGLPATDRELVIGSASDGATAPPAPAAQRSRLRRIRARARVDYLLRYRKVSLPTETCRPVLMAMSLGDQRSQARTGAAQHLLECQTCSSLAEPLVSRRSGLAALAFPVVAVRWLWDKARVHPSASTGVGAGAVAAGLAVTGIVAWAGGSQPHHTSGISATHGGGGPPASSWVPRLFVDARAPLPASAQLAKLSGQTVSGDVQVESVVTHNGFWVGPDASRRIWIQLIGPLRDLQLDAGDIVELRAVVIANPPGYPKMAGITNPTDAAQLINEDAHLEVSTSAITLLHD